MEKEYVGGCEGGLSKSKICECVGGGEKIKKCEGGSVKLSILPPSGSQME